MRYSACYTVLCPLARHAPKLAGELLAQYTASIDSKQYLVYVTDQAKAKVLKLFSELRIRPEGARILPYRHFFEEKSLFAHPEQHFLRPT